MSIGDFFKKFINAGEEYDEADEALMDEAEETGFDSRESDYEPPRPTRSRRPLNESNRVVDIRTTAMLQVVLVKPDKFEDARAIADHLNEKRTVVLNLEAASKDVARRLIDLLNGVAYANGGQLKKVSTNTYIITPYNVNVSGDLIDELESTGVFF